MRMRDGAKMAMRNTTVEAFRAFLMFSIVMCHACGFAFPNGFGGLFGAAVVGFVFISGWFGIRFSWTKVVRLILTAAYCMVVSMLAAELILGVDYSWTSYLCVFKRIQIYWFLWAYVALMLISPVVEFVFRHAREHGESPFKLFLPFLVMVYGWSYLQHIPQFRELLPKIEGFGSLSVFSLLAAYVVARLCRYYDLRGRVWAMRFNGFFLAVGILCSAGLVLAGFYHHHSPASIVLSTCAFFFVTKLNLPEGVGKVFVWVGPSLFSVYLMHCRGDGEMVLQKLSKVLSDGGVNAMVACCLSACIVFGACIVLDVPRRAMFGFYDWMVRKRGCNHA